MNNKLLLAIIFLGMMIAPSLMAQERVYQTFKDTRIVNSHSIETLKRGIMDFRVGHRFGDIAGDAGGWQTFYGLESAADVSIGFDFGLTDDWMVGISRAKGAGDLRQNINTFTKIRLMKQDNARQQISISVVGMGTISTMQKSSRAGEINSFEKAAHRISYNLQVLLARKFSPYFSLQLGGSWTYRNLVRFNDVNDLVSASAAARINFTKALGIVLDTTVPFSELRTTENGYYPIVSVGLEWETGGGHVFLVNMTNARGIHATDYIPYTTSSWGFGEYRLGFTIARQFNL